MNAKEYSQTLFGRVVEFDTVASDHAQYAKVFASGSTALEKNLLTLWDYGFKTIACGNGYDERLENFSLETEQNIQSRYDTYLNASGLQKRSMKKEDYLPKYHGYVSIDAASIDNPELFKKLVAKALKPFNRELIFSVEQGHTDGKPSLTVFLAVDRNKPSTYNEICLGAIEPEKALKMSLPKRDTFDKYFNAITLAVEKYSSKTNRQKGCLEKMETESAFCRVKALENENRFLKQELSSKENRICEQAYEITSLKLQVKSLLKQLDEPEKTFQRFSNKER